ncbi:hypothetical protein AVEN_927-1 [Araneus ventricosus]|uniref:Uncharacterized protein n=1 Tax=Araneus ventricosus TaxID=182803 RepID=A0A4Y2Q0Q5_ARAVE|nr:hypothetical protein AVEN_927-1 [Araneus ventricosus]
MISNPNQMMKTTPELRSTSSGFRSMLAGGRLTHIRFSVHHAHGKSGSSVESGSKPGAFRLQSQGRLNKFERPELE